MSAYFAQMFALGITGIDPLGGMIMLAFIAGGSTFRHSALFSTVNGVVTVAVGVLGSVLVDSIAGDISPFIARVPQSVWICLECTLSAVLLCYSAWHTYRTIRARDDEDNSSKPPTPRTASTSTIVWVSALFALAAFIDPGYPLGMIVSAGKPVLLVALAMTMWFVITQSPLLAVTIGHYFGAVDGVSAWIRHWMQRTRSFRNLAIAACIFLVAIIVAYHALFLATTGHWVPSTFADFIELE